MIISRAPTLLHMTGLQRHADLPLFLAVFHRRTRRGPSHPSTRDPKCARSELPLVDRIVGAATPDEILALTAALLPTIQIDGKW